MPGRKCLLKQDNVGSEHTQRSGSHLCSKTAYGSFMQLLEPVPHVLNNLLNCISFLPLHVVKYKEWIQILIQLVFRALLSLGLGLCQAPHIGFPNYRCSCLPVVLCQKLKKGLTDNGGC